MLTAKIIYERYSLRSKTYGSKFVLPGRGYEISSVMYSKTRAEVGRYFEREAQYFYSSFIVGEYSLPYKNNGRIKFKNSMRLKGRVINQDGRVISFLGTSCWGYVYTERHWKNPSGVQIWFTLLLGEDKDPIVFLGPIKDVKSILIEAGIC